MKQWIKDNIFGAVIVAIIIGASGFIVDNRTVISVQENKIETLKKDVSDKFENVMSAAKSNNEKIDDLKETVVKKEELLEVKEDLKKDIREIKEFLLNILTISRQNKLVFKNICDTTKLVTNESYKATRD